MTGTTSALVANGLLITNLKMDEQAKEQRIKAFADQKQNSIKESSIRRDSALFTASRLGTWKSVEQANYIKEYEYWIRYFQATCQNPKP